jgi:hypothetical protein
MKAFHREVLADAAGKKDEGSLLGGFLGDLERLQPVESRKVVVAQDQVGGARLERAAEVLAGLDALDLAGHPGLGELGLHVLRVEGVVLDVKKIVGLIH